MINQNSTFLKITCYTTDEYKNSIILDDVIEITKKYNTTIEDLIKILSDENNRYGK